MEEKKEKDTSEIVYDMPNLDKKEWVLLRKVGKMWKIEKAYFGPVKTLIGL